MNQPKISEKNCASLTLITFIYITFFLLARSYKIIPWLCIFTMGDLMVFYYLFFVKAPSFKLFEELHS